MLRILNAEPDHYDVEARATLESIGEVIDEMRALPLKDEVKEKWLYRNAARIFDLE